MANSFIRSTPVQAPADALFSWHERTGAFERLAPPWEQVRVRGRSGSIRNGDTLDLEVKLGPLPLRWRARHEAYVEGIQFCDVQEGGPFKKWRHVHHAIPDGDSAAVLRDEIEYELPLTPFSSWVSGRFVLEKFDRMFSYRHRVTRDDLAAHESFRGRGPLSVYVTGSGGLVGSTLIPFLTTGGHSVVSLPRPNGPAKLRMSSGSIDAVVHLAGAPIDGRWSAARKASILESRVDGTRRLCEWITRLHDRPQVLVCASAIGYYGNRESDWLDESSNRGEGFLSDVCAQWESATQRVSDAGIRVVHLRFGVVLSARGGSLRRMLPPFRAGLGGRLGSGQQYTSWIAIDDAIGAIYHAIQSPNLSGAVNAVSPDPVTNADFTDALGAVLGRPAALSLPTFAVRAAFGEMADALLLSSARCRPVALNDSGYTFRYPSLEEALAYQLGRMSLTTDA